MIHTNDATKMHERYRGKIFAQETIPMDGMSTNSERANFSSRVKNQAFGLLHFVRFKRFIPGAWLIHEKMTADG